MTEHYHTEPSEDCHPRVRQFYDYWLRIHPDEGLPGRQHFDPVDISALLPDIRLLDVVRDPIRFRVRLIGTRFCEFVGYDPTGQWLHEMLPGVETTYPYRGMVAIVKDKKPRWRQGQPFLFVPKDFLSLERIHLPLARDGENVDMILTLAVFIEGATRVSI